MTNKKPFGKTKIGVYELASWDNAVYVKDRDGKSFQQKKLGFSITRNIKKQDGKWDNKTINFTGINDLRAFASIIQEFMPKATNMVTDYREIEQKEKEEQEKPKVEEVKIQTADKIKTY